LLFVAPREVHERIAGHPINRIDELPPWSIVRRHQREAV